MEYIIGYLACSAAAFWLFQYDWRRSLDMNSRDLFMTILFAAGGPLSLFVALLVTVCGVLFRALPAQRIIWKRRP